MVAGGVSLQPRSSSPCPPAVGLGEAWLAPCHTVCVELYEVSLENFRAFDAATVTLPVNGLVLVAGANNTGKTALLSALDVVAGVGGDVAAWRKAGSSNPARVVVRFYLTESDRQLLFAVSPERDELLASGAARDLELVFEERDGQVPKLVEVRGLWPAHGGMHPFIAIHRGSDGSYGVEVISPLSYYPAPVQSQSLMVESQGHRWGGPVSLEEMHQSTRIPELSPVNTLLGAWRSRYYHFRALRTGTKRSGNLQSEATLLPTGENMSAVLLNLRTDRSDKFEALRRLVAQIVPDIGDLQIRTSGGLQVTFSTPEVELNLKDLGTGVEQLLLTLVVELTEAPPFLLVVEEPETNLHPAAQRALLGLLKDWANDRQIVAATHSPVMLDWSPGGDRLWHVTRQRGTSRVEPVREDPSALLNSLGVRLSDVFSADRVLVVEGASDEDVLEAWFPEVLRNPNVAVLHGGGGDSARHADRLAEWLASVDRIGLRQVLYLRDRDELSQAAFERLQNSRTVGVLARRELENYLLDPVALAVVFAEMANLGQPAPSPQEIAAVMRDAADGLRLKVIINRVCRQIQPARPLMENSLRQELASAGASKDEIIAAIMERLMTPEDLREQTATAWAAAERDVASCDDENLLVIAPGEEILNVVFQRFAGRRYKKRDDGVTIAKTMPAPPSEIRNLLEKFMADT